MTANNLTNILAERFQKEKDRIAFIRRKDREWYEAFPVSIRQTLFPSVFQDVKKEE